MDIDAVEQRTADLGQIALNDRRRAAAFPRTIAIESAWAPVQISIALSSGFTGHHGDMRHKATNCHRLNTNQRGQPGSSGHAALALKIMLTGVKPRRKNRALVASLNVAEGMTSGNYVPPEFHRATFSVFVASSTK